MSPLVVDSAGAVEWHDVAEVLVVGFGGAGVAAALEARENGADVLAIDRFGGGGATQFSGGVIYSGGTRFQREAGFDDTPQEMFNYLSAEGTPLSDDALKDFCDNSNADLEWLAGHGVPYGSNAFLEKTAFPPDGYWLYYSGNENTARFRARARPAPRGHRVLTPGNGGWLHFQKLREAALARGVRQMQHAAAKRLITDKRGRVIGLELLLLPPEKWADHEKIYSVVNPWKPFNNRKAERAVKAANDLEQRHGMVRRIRALSGVILASGGFIYNLDMLARYQPEVARSYQGLLRLGSLGCDGSGIALGASAGGRTDLMDQLFIGSPLSPPLAFVSGIIVNRQGKRFVAEDSYHADIGNALIRQPGCKAWLILESRTFWRAMKEALFPGKGMFMQWGAPALLNASLGGTRRASSLAKLAGKCGVDSEGLRHTIDQYNRFVAGQKDEDFGKSPDKLHEIADGPFYAVNLALDNYFQPTMAFTLGGLVVEETSGLVLSDHGPIEGLYAAGRTAVGICSHGYMSGLSIADTVYSGRRAGRHAALKQRAEDTREDPSRVGVEGRSTATK